jgi:hypothetical protein
MTLAIPSDPERPPGPLVSTDQVELFRALFGPGPEAPAWAAHLAGEAPLSLDPGVEGRTSLAVITFHGRVGRTWKTDAVQVAQAADRLALPIHLERLPEADPGIHLWIFFSRPLPVLQARRLASALLYSACSGDLKQLKSFDQVVPGDEEAPRPVVLPLFGAAVLRGESVFVAPARGLPALPDQWAALAAASRLEEAEIERILARAGGKSGGWAPSPAAPSDRVHASLSASLVVRRPLPRTIATRLRRRLTFPNPEHVRRKREGMSLRRVPRLLTAWRRRQSGWLLPRGVEAELRGWCDDDGLDLDLGELRSRWPDEPRAVPPGLLPEQRALLDRLLPHPMATVVSADDVTRTTVALAVAAERGQPTLLLAANRLRVQHWREQALLSGFEEDEVRLLSALPAHPVPLIVATYGEVHGHADRLEGRFGHLILDDCSRTPIEALREGAASVPAWFVLGLSDGQPRADGLDDLVGLLAGSPLSADRASDDSVLDVVLRTTRFQHLPVEEPESDEEEEEEEKEEPADELFSMPRPIRRGPRSTASPSTRSREWNALLDALSHDPARNRLVAGDVVAEARQGNRCLVLTARREHAAELAEHIGRGVAVAIATGSMAVGRRREALRQFREGEVRVLVVTEQLMGPGFDPAHVSRLFLALPLKPDGQLRHLLAVVSRGDAVRVYDYVDDRVPRLQNMAQARRRYYRKTKTTLNPDAMQLRLPFE